MPKFELIDSDEESAPSQEEIEIAPSQEEIEISPKTRKIAEDFKFFGSKPFTPEQIEKVRKPLIQHLVTPAAEGVSRFFGSFGDLASLANKLLGKPFMGKEYEDIPYFGQLFPTYERVHEGLEEFAGEKLRPETPFQEFTTAGTGFLGSLLALNKGKFLGAGTIPFTKKVLQPLTRNLVAAFGPAAVSVGLKEAELPPSVQATGTIGTAILTSALTNKSITSLKNDLYGMRNKMSKNVLLPGEPLAKDLNGLYGKMQKGGLTSVEKHIMGFLDNIKSKAEGGYLELDEAISARSKLFQESKMFTKKQRKGTERFWNEAERILNKQIKSYKNPKFQNINNQANSINKGIEESKRMENFLIKNKWPSSVGGGIAYLSKVIGLGSGLKGLAVTKAYNFTRALARNKSFRDAWKNVFKRAFKQDVKGTVGIIKKFQEEATKEGLIDEETKPRFELVD